MSNLLLFELGNKTRLLATQTLALKLETATVGSHQNEAQNRSPQRKDHRDFHRPRTAAKQHDNGANHRQAHNDAQKQRATVGGELQVGFLFSHAH